MERARKIGGICLFTGAPMILIGAVLNFYSPFAGWATVAVGTALCLYCGLIELINSEVR